MRGCLAAQWPSGGEQGQDGRRDAHAGTTAAMLQARATASILLTYVPLGFPRNSFCLTNLDRGFKLELGSKWRIR